MIPTEIFILGRAIINDASACALIVDNWIEKIVEMPRLLDKHEEVDSTFDFERVFELKNISDFKVWLKKLI